MLDSLTLVVESGAIVGLVGPNGVGKTTLLRLIAGLIPGSVDCVRVDGMSVREGRRFRQKVFFIEELRSLDLRLSGWDYLRYVKDLWHSRASIDGIVTALGVGPFVRRPLQRLSQGMQQQVVLALALVSEAPVILLDEPMNSLDPSNTDIVSQQMHKLKERGATILLSTHLLSNIDELADRVVFLKDGRASYTRDHMAQRPSLELYREFYPNPLRTNQGDSG